MGLLPIHYVILSGVVTLVGKVIWDWLANRTTKQNGTHTAEALTRIEGHLEEMVTRQRKMWEHMLGERQKQD